MLSKQWFHYWNDKWGESKCFNFMHWRCEEMFRLNSSTSAKYRRISEDFLLHFCVHWVEMPTIAENRIINKWFVTIAPHLSSTWCRLPTPFMNWNASLHLYVRTWVVWSTSVNWNGLSCCSYVNRRCNRRLRETKPHIDHWIQIYYHFYWSGWQIDCTTRSSTCRRPENCLFALILCAGLIRSYLFRNEAVQLYVCVPIPATLIGQIIHFFWTTTFLFFDINSDRPSSTPFLTDHIHRWQWVRYTARGPKTWRELRVG